MDYQQDLLSMFLLMNWLRMLKFFRIPEFTGPTVQSIMDTLQAKDVIIFETIIIYIVLTFSITFHIAFGPDVVDYSNFGLSLIAIFLAIFGSHDLGPLQTSNRLFGPLLFVILLLFLLFVLMNLLVGVLGSAYGDVQEVNFQRWNRFITRLMIEATEDRVERENAPPSTYRMLADFIRNKIFRQADIEAAVDNLVEAEEEEAAKGGHLGALIYRNEEELDEMLVPEEDEDGGEDDDAAVIEQKQKTIDEFTALEKRIEQIEKTHEKINEQYQKEIGNISAKLEDLMKALATRQ